MPESRKARRRRKAKARLKRKVKRRNPHALEARMRGGAGTHGHPAKEASKKACRSKVDVNDHLED